MGRLVGSILTGRKQRDWLMVKSPVSWAACSG